MSFSKARIQRFNELPSEAPPPGSYDPKFDSRVKSFLIEKTERFQDTKSVSSSGGECNLSVSSKGTGVAPSPKFRTPQLPKKRTVAKTTNMSCPKAKTKLALGSSKDLKYDVRDELADLKVECANKDKTIQDHAKQIEELKKETWKLEKEIAELLAKQEEVQEQHRKDLETMATLQQEIQDSRDQKHHAEVTLLRSELLKITEAKDNEMLSEKTRWQLILDNEMKKMDDRHIDAQREITKLNEELTEVKREKKHEIEVLSGVVAEKENELARVRTEATVQQEIQNSRDEKHHAEVELLRSQLSEITETKENEILAEKTKWQLILDEKMKTMELRHMDADRQITKMKKKLAEVKKGKEHEIKMLSDLVTEKERKLAHVLTELNKVELISEEMRSLLSGLENDREAEIVSWKNEQEALRTEVAELSKVKSELESKLETRQQVVLELQSQHSTLQCEVDELRAEYNRLVSDSEIEIRELTDRYDREWTDMRYELLMEQEVLQREKQAEIARRLDIECEREERAETNAFLTEELQNVQKLYKDTSRRLKETQEILEMSNEKYIQTLNSHKEEIENIKSHHRCEKSRLEELLEKTRLEYLRELDNMTEARNNELKAVMAASERTIEEERRRITERTDKIVENAEAVTRETLAACRAESEERVKKIIADSDVKVKGMVRDARKAVEEEMREAADRYVNCLTRVEAEKAVLEEKLAQRDAEIVKLSVTLDELKIVVENQESFSQSLQVDLDRVEAELAERKDELRALKDQIRSEAAEMVARRRRFEVVMAENQASVAALSQRLYESDAEVERLQNELKTGEDSIHEHRGLLSAMRNTSKILSEELYTLMEQLDENKGRFDQLEAGNLAEIETLRSLFFAEIETLKHISAKEMKRLEEECKKKSEENEELKNHLDAMAIKLSEARDVLLKFEELEDTRAIEISQLELEKEKHVQELKIQAKAMEEKNVLLETKEAESKLALHAADEQVALLMTKLATLQTEKIDVEKLRAEREQGENELKEETSRRRAAEEEVKKLTDDCDTLRKSYQEVSDKYAEMIGHHNHKQRVKHVNQLKDKIIRLEKDVEKKKHMIDQQTKTIEKLKAEDKRSFAKGKENLHSHGISRSPYTTPASSPLKPLTPLRERNE